jgi:hypothetical protein
MQFQAKLLELHEYIEKWGREVREELKLIGLPPNLLAFDPKSFSQRLSETQAIKLGHYVSRDHNTTVIVQAQDPRTGLIVMEVLNALSSTDRFQTMSPGIFKALFKPHDGDTLNKELLTEVFQHNRGVTESEKRTHLEARKKSFEWSSIEEATDHAAYKWRNLNQSLARKDWQELQADYLELVFLVFILGARLGHAPRDDFAVLVQSVMDLTDDTEDACVATQRHYEEKGVKCAHYVYTLYDPEYELAPPHKRYVVYSVEDQFVGGLHYGKGAFLPALGANVTYPHYNR